MKTLLGIFPDRTDAENAITELENAGLDSSDISVIVRDEESLRIKTETTQGDTVASSALSGATTGGVIGGIAGLLIGIGAIAIPGLGVLLIGGPLAAALGLTGAAATTVSGAATGALAGGLVGALTGIGVPEETARIYETRVKEGSVLLAVPLDTDDDSNDIKDVFQKWNASQIQTISGKSGSLSI